MTAYDSAAASNTGLPWPDLTDAGVVSLLPTLRTAAGPATGETAFSVALPVPGDVRGLAAGTQFQADAVAAGEAVIVRSRSASDSQAVGLVPDFVYTDDDDPDYDPEPSALSWTVYSLASAPVAVHVDLGQAEYDLRAAVRSAADAMGRLRAELRGADIDDPRGMVEQVLEASRLHRAPDYAPERALRVLENAAHVDAIITVSAGLMPIGLQSSSEVQMASDALRPLADVVRSARLAAVGAVLQAAWRS